VLDAAQVTDLLGTMGLGVAAQVVDSVARKIVGGVFEGVLGRLLGGLAGGVAGAATGAATSFATTYALGHAAQQYYAQGRTLSPDDLRTLFDRLKDEAVALYPGRVQERGTETRRGSTQRPEPIRGPPGTREGEPQQSRLSPGRERRLWLSKRATRRARPEGVNQEGRVGSS
jgi:hypothetical protein